MNNKQDATVVEAWGKVERLAPMLRDRGLHNNANMVEEAVAALKQLLAQPQADALTDEKISEIYQATWNEDGQAVRQAPATPELVFRFARNIVKGFLAQPQAPMTAEQRIPDMSKEWCAKMAKLEDGAGDFTVGVQPQAPVVPEGWRLVPIEADHNMRDAGFAAFRAKGLFDDIFRAMALAAPDAPQPEPSQRDERDINEMVNRFLGWSIPKSFSPDCGISFDGRKDDELNKGRTWPVGTNLFTADEARQMFEYVTCAASKGKS